MSLAKGCGPLSNFNPLYTTVFCAKFGLDWSSGFWEKYEQIYRRTTWRADNRRPEQLTGPLAELS